MPLVVTLLTFLYIFLFAFKWLMSSLVTIIAHLLVTFEWDVIIWPTNVAVLLLAVVRTLPLHVAYLITTMAFNCNVNVSREIPCWLLFNLDNLILVMSITLFHVNCILSRFKYTTWYKQIRLSFVALLILRYVVVFRVVDWIRVVMGLSIDFVNVPALNLIWLLSYWRVICWQHLSYSIQLIYY
jgi:hypothetical protein